LKRAHFLLGIAVFLGVQQLGASLLPDASFSVSASDGQGGNCQLNTAGNCVLGVDATTGTINLVPPVSLFAFATSTGDGVPQSATSTLMYSFMPVGGNPTDQVRVLVTVALQSSITVGLDLTQEFGESYITILSPYIDANGHTSNSFASATACSKKGVTVCDGSTSDDSFFGVLHLLSSPGQVANVNLTAAAYVLGVGTATAFLDPVISIDPNQPNANLYSIQVSAGVPNSAAAPASATPEPASMLLAGGALFAIAVARRRRKQNLETRLY